MEKDVTRIQAGQQLKPRNVSGKAAQNGEPNLVSNFGAESITLPGRGNAVLACLRRYKQICRDAILKRLLPACDIIAGELLSRSWNQMPFFFSSR